MTMHTDEEVYLVAKVQEAIARDPRTHKQDVRVSTVGGALVLDGQTTTEDRRVAIEAVVTELYPDLEVRNRLVVIEVATPGAPEVIA